MINFILLCTYLSSVISFLSSLFSVIGIIYACFRWNSIEKEKGIELYSVFYEHCQNILKVLYNRDLFEFDGYFPDKYPTESIEKDNAKRSKYRPYRLIWNELQIIKKQSKNYILINDEQLIVFCKTIECIASDILAGLQAEDMDEDTKRSILQDRGTLKDNAEKLKQEIRKISEYLMKKIKK